MKYGISLPNFGRDADKENIVSFALAAEQLGFDSIWVSDHIVIPFSHEGFGDTFYEPIVTLSYLASITNRVRLGTSVLILPYKNPVVLAKMIATLDSICCGRIIFGVGSGWLEKEFESLGSDFKNRGKITDEYIRILTNLWSEDYPEFSGKYFHFSELLFRPKPHQIPYPPLWIGGNSETAMDRAVRYGNGWHAVGLTLPEIRIKVNQIENKLGNGVDRHGRLVISLRKNIRMTGEINTDLTRSGVMRGNVKQIVCALKEYESSGVDYMILQFLGSSFDEILEDMHNFYDELVK